VRCGCFGKSGPLGRMLSPVFTGANAYGITDWLGWRQNLAPRGSGKGATTHATMKSAITSRGCGRSEKHYVVRWLMCAASALRFPLKAMLGSGLGLRPR